MNGTWGSIVGRTLEGIGRSPGLKPRPASKAAIRGSIADNILSGTKLCSADVGLLDRLS
jgi:hypothetical protein